MGKLRGSLPGSARFISLITDYGKRSIVAVRRPYYLLTTMKEGWHNDDYLILFEGSEIEEKEKDYEIDRFLPGCRLLGMVGWDYFLVMDRESQKVFRVPTIPIVLKEREEWTHKIDSAELKPDGRFQGKVKWYLKPVVFGGDPNPGKNLVWISHEDHVQGVKYWNQMYSDVTHKR